MLGGPAHRRNDLGGHRRGPGLRAKLLALTLLANVIVIVSRAMPPRTAAMTSEVIAATTARAAECAA